MAKQDYYQLLGVEKGASPEDVKAAYRKAAMRYHPDRNRDDPDAEQKFKEVSEAYDVLKDDQKRAAYDRFGHAAFENGGMGAGAGARGFDFGQGFAGGGFADIFDEMFGDFMGRGRARAGSAANRGSDLRYNLEVSLEDAFHGSTAKIRVPSSVTCEVCSGSGAEAGSEPVVCPTCAGIGKVRATQGFFTIERTCPACGGQGRVIQSPCKACGGQGRVRRERTLSVTIPAGVEDGMRMRLAGEGEAGLRGAAPGDLYVFLSVKPHPLFQREGTDLFCTVPVAMTTAALGGTIEVPTLDGNRAKIAVPAGTQPNTKFRLRGKGMPTVRGSSKGDLYVEVEVETPQHLTKEQKELLTQFEKAGEAGKTSPRTHGFVSRLKEFFEDLKG